MDWQKRLIKRAHHRSISAVAQRFKHHRINVDAQRMNRTAGHDKIGATGMRCHEAPHKIIGGQVCYDRAIEPIRVVHRHNFAGIS